MQRRKKQSELEQQAGESWKLKWETVRFDLESKTGASSCKQKNQVKMEQQAREFKSRMEEPSGDGAAS